MVSVTPASCYLSRSSICIQGLIAQKYRDLDEAVPIACHKPRRWIGFFFINKPNNNTCLALTVPYKFSSVVRPKPGSSTLTSNSGRTVKDKNK